MGILEEVLEMHGNNQFKGIDTAKKILELGVKKGFPIHLKGDPDVDGMFAWFTGYQILKTRFKNIVSSVNRDRKHGLVEIELEEPKNYKPLKGNENFVETRFHKNEIIINVDSSISGKEMQFLVDNGNFVISLDHHELELEGFSETQREFVSEKGREHGWGIIINNQYPDEPAEKRFYSGTGVVIEVLAEIIGVERQLEWLVMHGITLLSDVRDIENTLARKVLELTYSTSLGKLPTIDKLVGISEANTPDLFKQNIRYLNRTFIDYVFSPYYNAMYQLNLGEVIVKLCSNPAFKIAIPVKEVRKKIVEHLSSYVKVKEYNHLIVLYVDLNKVEPLYDIEEEFDFSFTSFLGLIANKHLKHGKPVFIMCTQGSKWLRGSVRGISSEVDYRKIFGDNGFEVKGHKIAFGVTNILAKPQFLELDKELGYQSEGVSKNSYTVYTSKDLASDLEKIKELAYENQFLLSSHFHAIVFTGVSYTVVRETKGTKSYNVGGMIVGTYDKDLDVKKSYIIPTLEKDVVVLTLEG